MALQKSTSVPGGYEANYWRADEIFFNRQAGNLSGVLFLYKDAAARGAGEASVRQESRSFSGVTLEDFSEANPIALFYSKVKESVLDAEGRETNFFADAVDA